ncbi:MAG: SDR family oxidoreductase [Alphaproteobacteria bacterium]|nr:SDR family oxidoreductase [Alphaproteobacteria bacterium]
MSTALVTGANRGIGLELTRQLLARGAQVIACCRAPSPELEASGARVEALDVADGDSIAALAQRLEGVALDLLLHNAGILQRVSLDQLDVEACRRQFEVNALGPLRLTAALLPNLSRGSKVAIVTSRMGSMADNGSGGHYGYRMSKAAVNMAGTSLAKDLAPKGIAVGLLHPGWVRTDMTGGSGHVTAEESAAGLLARVDELGLSNSGGFWHAQGERLPW